MKVLVTNCTRNSGLTVMRALSAAGCNVSGADDRVFAFGLHSRSAVASYSPLPPENHPRFASALLALLDRSPPEVLIPTRGIEAACLARDAIAQKTRSLLPTYDAFETLNDKGRLLSRCAELGIAAPRRFELAEAREFLRVEEARVVVKPLRDIGGGVGVHFVSTPQALDEVHRAVQREHGDALITEYIPGPTDHLRAVHFLFDSASRLIAFFVLRKLRIWPADVGVTVAAVSTHEIEIVQSLLPLLKAIHWQGPADAELKIDARDGRIKLIEINPRFSGAIHFPIACGVNMPLLFCRAALGEQLPEAREPSYPAGLHYLDGTRWLSAALAEIKATKTERLALLKRIWRQELRPPRVPSVHALTDPAPLLGKLLMVKS